MMGSLHYAGLALFVAVCVVIVIVFDSPTSVFLVLGLSLALFGLSGALARKSR